MLTILAFLLSPAFFYGAREAPVFSMVLTGLEGLNATTINGRRTVSPVFSLKARMDNPRALQSWCYDSGEVVVSYSGVALAWGHVPHFCVHKGAPTEFTGGWLVR
nr:unnamed protein product [Digitaria exilis]